MWSASSPRVPALWLWALLSSSSRSHTPSWPIASLFSLFLFISSWGSVCSFYSLISHLLRESAGMSGTPFSGSLSPFLLRCLPSFFLTPHVYVQRQAGGGGRSPFSVHIFPEALQNFKALRMAPEGFHSPGKHRGIFSPSHSFFQMPWAVQVYIPEGEEAVIRSGGGGQEN